MDGFEISPHARTGAYQSNERGERAGPDTRSPTRLPRRPQTIPITEEIWYRHERSPSYLPKVRVMPARRATSTRRCRCAVGALEAEVWHGIASLAYPDRARSRSPARTATRRNATPPKGSRPRPDRHSYGITAAARRGKSWKFGLTLLLRALAIIRGPLPCTRSRLARAAAARYRHEADRCRVDEQPRDRPRPPRLRRAGRPRPDLDRSEARLPVPLLLRRSGTLRKQTKSMLYARATAEAAPLAAAMDAMLYLPLIAEELAAADSELHSPLTGDGASTYRGRALPTTNPDARRARGCRTATPRAALPAAPPAAACRAAARPRAAEQRTAAWATPRPTKPQLAKLHAYLRDIAITTGEGRRLVSAAQPTATSPAPAPDPRRDRPRDQATSTSCARCASTTAARKAPARRAPARRRAPPDDHWRSYPDDSPHDPE